MSIFSDSFDSYSNGNLNGQGSWSGDTNFQIQETTKYSGAKGVSCDATGKTIAKSGTLTADGSAFAYFRTNSESGAWFELWEGTNQITYARFNHASGRGKLQASLAGIYEDVPGSITNDEFNKVTVEWRSSDKKVRWSLNNGSFTDWKTTYANFSSGLDKIRLVTSDVSVGGCCYFDDVNIDVVTPTVTTQAVDQVASTSVRGNGNITATGGANATRRGFCYKVGTSGDPTTSDSVAYDDGDFSTGAYTKSITGLSSGTSYRIRAYAVNSAGTSYGDTVQAITTAAFTSLSLNLTIPSITATFQRVATAAFTPLSLLLTIPANTASYVYEKAASFTSLSLKQTIPAITASFENIKLAVFTPLSIIFNIPIFRHWENQIKHISSISNINKMGAGWIYNDNDLTYNMPELYYNSFGGVINFTNQTKHTATIKNLRK